MSKKLYLTIFLSFILLFPMNIGAHEHLVSDEPEYVYEIIRENIVVTAGNQISYNTTVQYEGTIVPPASLYHTCIKNGVIYAGTLSLVSFYYQNNKTYATYRGTLTSVN